MRKLLLGLLLTPVIVWGAGGEAEYDRDIVLARAVATNDLVLYEKVLKKEAADTDFKNRILWDAAARGSLAVCELALRHRAEIRFVDDRRQNPWGIAGFEGHTDVYQLLVAHLHSIGERTNGAGLNDFELLIILAIRGALHHIPLAIERGQGPEVIKKYGDILAECFEHDGEEVQYAAGWFVRKARRSIAVGSIISRATLGTWGWKRRGAAVVRAVMAGTLPDGSAGEEPESTDGAGAAGGAGGS